MIEQYLPPTVNHNLLVESFQVENLEPVVPFAPEDPHIPPVVP